MLSGLDRLVKRDGAGDGDSTGNSTGSSAGLNGREMESEAGREETVLRGRDAG